MVSEILQVEWAGAIWIFLVLWWYGASIRNRIEEHNIIMKDILKELKKVRGEKK